MALTPKQRQARRLWKMRALGLGYEEGNTQTPSAVWLDGREGVAFIPDGDWLTIIDNGTPANNYDGLAADHPSRTNYTGRAFGLPLGSAVPEPVGGHTFFIKGTEVGINASTIAVAATSTNYSDFRFSSGTAISVNGTTQAAIVVGADVGVLTTFACRYAVNDFAVSKDGAVPSTDTSGTYGGASYTELTFFSREGGANSDQSTDVEAFLYLTEPLADAELRALVGPS